MRLTAGNDAGTDAAAAVAEEYRAETNEGGIRVLAALVAVVMVAGQRRAASVGSSETFEVRA